ncbi:dinitrogenase iron-molybdenum cofactor biosynthesis protein [Candidatus Bathyarchaeota archaeon]|nr:MAG: dinitrogenase iron-molybdenum cofactor biosynthesis protein [Candidatus Bathyarchaeota archaeon]
MKVAVSATGPSLDAQVDPRFGRCAYFVIVDTETMQFESIQNTSQYSFSGAGIQAAQLVASKGVKAVLTGNVGPNAYQALSAAGIQIVTGAYGTVREAVMRYKRGELGGATSPTAPMHYGMGGGYGMGMGRGMGRGMGMRRGMGGFMPPAYPGPVAPLAPTAPSTPQMTKEQEIQLLKEQMKTLQKQLEQIKKRLKELGE